MPLDLEARPPCPVCGASEGNCGPLDGHDDVTVPLADLSFREWSSDYRPTERTPSMADIIATARVYEEVPLARSDRTRRVLRYGIGAVIPEAEAKRLNVSGDGTQSTVPKADADTGPTGTASAAQPTPAADDATTARTTATPARKAAPAKKAAKKAAAAKKAR